MNSKTTPTRIDRAMSSVGTLIFWSGWLFMKCTLGFFRPPIVIGDPANLRGCINMAHTSNWDYVAINLLVRTYPILKRELYDKAPRLFRVIGVIRIDRSDRRSGAAAIRTARRRQEEGGRVLVYPQGTRSQRIITVDELPSGAEAFAKTANEFVLVGVAGLRGLAWFRRRPVLVIGPSFTKDNRPVEITSEWLRAELELLQTEADYRYHKLHK